MQGRFLCGAAVERTGKSISPLVIGLAVAVIVLLFVAPSAEAQITNWVPVGSGVWSVPANWSSVVPNQGTLITNVINGGSANIIAPADTGPHIQIFNGSTVALQAGGSLTLHSIPSDPGRGEIVVGSGSTFLLNGSTAVGGDPFLTLAGGTLRALTTGTFDVRIRFGAQSTISAAAGRTLTLTGDFGGNSGSNGVLRFGASDTGAINFGSSIFDVLLPFPSIEVNSGTLRHPVSGGGVLILTSEAPRTTVASGATLEINGPIDGGISNLFGSGNIVINNVASQLPIQSGIFSGVISGPGGIVRKHMGNVDGLSDTLILSGNNTYTGNTTVAGGLLVVNGSIVSDVTVTGGQVVGSTGALGGTGTVGGISVQQGGAIAPGNSIGTLRARDNVTFFSGSTFQVEANAVGQADRLIVGTFPLLPIGLAKVGGGTVLVAPQVGLYITPITYTILTAAGGVFGTFAGVTSNASFLAPSLTYDANNVFLTLRRVAIGSTARTVNELSAGAAIDQFDTDNSLFLAVANLPSGPGRWQGFDAISGEVHASTQSVLLDESRYVRQAILGRLRTATYGDATGSLGALSRGAAMYAALDNERYMADPAMMQQIVPPHRMDTGVWAQGYGSWGRLGNDNNAAGVDRRIGGFVGGIDTGTQSIGPFTLTRLGIAGGYSQSDVDVKARASHASIETAQLGAYWASNLWGLSFRSGTALAFHSIDTNRFIAFPGFNDTASARYDARTFQSFGEVGYGFALGGLGLEPFAGLTSVWVETDRFSEIGGPAALFGASENTSLTYSSLGLRVAHAMTLANGMSLTARGTFAWQHAFGDIAPNALVGFRSNAIVFGIQGVPVARDAALVEAGLDLENPAQRDPRRLLCRATRRQGPGPLRQGNADDQVLESEIRPPHPPQRRDPCMGSFASRDWRGEGDRARASEAGDGYGNRRLAPGRPRCCADGMDEDAAAGGGAGGSGAASRGPPAQAAAQALRGHDAASGRPRASPGSMAPASSIWS